MQALAYNHLLCAGHRYNLLLYQSRRWVSLGDCCCVISSRCAICSCTDTCPAVCMQALYIFSAATELPRLSCSLEKLCVSNNNSTAMYPHAVVCISQLCGFASLQAAFRRHAAATIEKVVVWKHVLTDVESHSWIAAATTGNIGNGAASPPDITPFPGSHYMNPPQTHYVTRTTATYSIAGASVTAHTASSNESSTERDRCDECPEGTPLNTPISTRSHRTTQTLHPPT